MKNVIQIAGIRDWAEAELLISCRADYLGFPLRLAVHSEDISDQDASSIIKRIPAGITPVLITYLTRAKEVSALSQFLSVRVIQLHADPPRPDLSRLRKEHPDYFIIKSLIVRGDNLPELLEYIEVMSPLVDAFITDTYDPVSGGTGATGITHDWAISRKIVESSSRPVILAGGLTPENVRQAILAVRPAGVDVHSGVEDASGRKDRQKVQDFVTAARKAFYEISTSGKNQTGYQDHKII